MQKPIFTGYDGKPYTLGDTVEIHPDVPHPLGMAFIGGMRADVVGCSITEKDRVHVAQHISRRKFSGSEDTFRYVGTWDDEQKQYVQRDASQEVSSGS